MLLEAAGPSYAPRIAFNTDVLQRAAAACPAWATELAAASAKKMVRLLADTTAERILRLEYLAESGCAPPGMGQGLSEMDHACNAYLGMSSEFYTGIYACSPSGSRESTGCRGWDASRMLGALDHWKKP